MGEVYVIQTSLAEMLQANHIVLYFNVGDVCVKQECMYEGCKAVLRVSISDGADIPHMRLIGCLDVSYLCCCKEVSAVSLVCSGLNTNEHMC